MSFTSQPVDAPPEGTCTNPACRCSFTITGRPIMTTAWDARLHLCPECRTVWLAERDQRYAEARETNRAICAKKGRHRIVALNFSPRYCDICGEQDPEKLEAR